MRSRGHLKVDHRPWEVLFSSLPTLSLTITPIFPHFHSQQPVSYTAVTHFWLEFFSNMFHTSGFNDPSKSMICYSVSTASRTLISIALETCTRAGTKVMPVLLTGLPIFRLSYIIRLQIFMQIHVYTIL